MNHKQLSKLALALGAMVMAGGAMAQSTANANGTANANVIRPISISAVNSLEFGNIAVAAGDVTVSVAGERSFTNTQNNPGAANLGTTIRQATFTIGGEGASTYAITLPANDVVTLITDGGGENKTMAVKSFLSDPATTGKIGGTAGTAGTQTLNVGATLVVGAGQVPGSYTGTFNVVVAYN